MRSPLLWHRPRARVAAPFAALSVVEPLAASAEGRWLPARDAQAPAALLFLSTDVPVVGVALLLLVPDALGACVRLDGCVVGAGLHALRHGAQLALVGTDPATDPATDFWVSLHCEGVAEPYDPARHGADRHCFLLKAKLKPGEPVTPCPGVPSTPCGVFYRGAAWATVRACTNCGHAPATPAWAPPDPVQHEGRSLRELFARARS